MEDIINFFESHITAFPIEKVVRMPDFEIYHENQNLQNLEARLVIENGNKNDIHVMLMIEDKNKGGVIFRDVQPKPVDGKGLFIQNVEKYLCPSKNL